MGRKNKYDTHVKPFLHDIAEWYQTMTEGQISERLGISQASFETYKKDHEELRECLVNAKEKLCTDLKETLKRKALGYEYEETKTSIRRENGREITVIEKTTRYAHPDTGAIHLLLKNLDPAWRNDDQATIDFKNEKLKLEKMKAEAETW